MPRKIVIANPRSGRDLDDFALEIIKFFQPEILKKPGPFDIERFFDCVLEKITGVKTGYRRLPLGMHGYTDSATGHVVSFPREGQPAAEHFIFSSQMSLVYFF